MNVNDLKVGQLYTLAEDVPNPAGSKMNGTTILRHAYLFPKGIRLRCASHSEMLRDLNLPDGGDPRPWALVLLKGFRLKLAGRDREQRVSADDRIYLHPGPHVPDADLIARDRLVKVLVPVEPDVHDLFRFAGLPLDDRNDNTFLAACRWAAEEGLLSLKQVQAWEYARRRQAKEQGETP